VKCIKSALLTGKVTFVTRQRMQLLSRWAMRQMAASVYPV